MNLSEKLLKHDLIHIHLQDKTGNLHIVLIVGQKCGR